MQYLTFALFHFYAFSLNIQTFVDRQDLDLITHAGSFGFAQ